MDVVKLPKTIVDVDAMKALNARLRDRGCVLDWSDVTDGADNALTALLDGIELDAHAEELGIGTVPDALAERVERFLAQPGAKRSRAKRKAALSADQPAMWRRSESDRPPATATITASRPLALESSARVRDHIVEALHADLIGPFLDTPDAAREELPLAPSHWYLAGFLAPQLGRDQVDPTNDEEMAAGDDDDGEETSAAEPEAKRPKRLAASIGISVLLPAGAPSDTMTATVSYADYAKLEPEPETDDDLKKKRPRARWLRVPRAPVSVTVPLDAAELRKGVRVPESRGIVLEGHIKEARAPGLPPGARAVTLFLVNRRPPEEAAGRQDEQFIFQVGLEVGFPGGLLPRPNRRDEASEDWDEQVSDLQYRDRMEHAVGHGVSVQTVERAGKAVAARTTWIPKATVRRVITHEISDVCTSMEELAEMKDAASVRSVLAPLAETYGAWIAAQRTVNVGTAAREATKASLLGHAETARARITRGIAALEEHPDAFEAFRLANKAMAIAARRRSPERYPEGEKPQWRLFQLAFLLMNLGAFADERAKDREIVDLIFFPTGGGKTEAYLGLIAFTLVLRRLRGQQRPDRGLGVAVLLRYTLRLLTLDQLSRAATLICALESLRTQDVARLGEVRFTVGLWVGRKATANTLTHVAEQITEYKNSNSKDAPSPFPLTECPWCLQRLGKDGLVVLPKSSPREVIAGCTNFRCDFSQGKTRDGLPVLFVDEQIYRELPSFLVATVDKFAMLPWRGETAALFGHVASRLGKEFFGAMDGPTAPKGAEMLPDGLRPPELIVQDELHLISGPLGTMVGLYETAIETLSLRNGQDGKPVLPKIVASTATVRRAGQQIRALFGRRHVALFPPPGVDDSETFFAKVDHVSPGRVYVGVAGPGRALKAILLRTYVSLLSAGQRCFDPAGPPSQPADPYMTIAGYFNSLRELGGMRRLVEDEVRARCAKSGERVPTNFRGDNPWLENRHVQAEPVELTSRESTHSIAVSKSRLGKQQREDNHVDVLLASNMISVGVDIERLGLMVVAGQPKTTSEYIQASSRVGRDPKRPGLVVTVFNLHKPRDRSHYERFCTFHESFYRFVEATSVTPFSGPALDRGLAGVLVAMTRLSDDDLTPPDGLTALATHRTVGDAAVAALAQRAGRCASEVDSEAYNRVVDLLTKRGKNLLDAWQSIVEARLDGGATPRYSRLDKGSTGKPLLFTVLDEDLPPAGSHEAKFQTNTSMRDVEPSVHLWKRRRALKKEVQGGR